MFIDSKINKVTIYSEHGLVERIANIDSIDEGIQELVVKKIPFHSVRDSLKVKCLGNAIIKSVSIENIWEKDALRKKKTELLTQLDYLNSKLQIQKNIKELLDKYLIIAKSDIENRGESNLIKGNLFDFLKNYEVESEDVLLKTKLYNEDIEKINKEISNLDHKIEIAVKNIYSNISAIKIILEVKKKGAISIEFKYLSRNIKWKPIYDYRVDKQNNTGQLVCNAQVFQTTDEDWNDILVSFSSTIPQFKNEVPEIEPLNLYKTEPDKVGVKNIHRFDEKLSDRPLANAKRTQRMFPFAINDELALEIAIQAKEKSTKAINLKSQVINYNLSERKTIPSNSQSLIELLSVKNDIDYEYIGIPLHSEHPFTKVKTKNLLKHGLLSGDINIYVDNMFISKNYISYKGIDEEFKINCGNEKNIILKRIKISDLLTKSSFFGSEIKRTIIYNIEVENNSDKEIEVKIKDRIPLGNKDIRVKFEKPNYDTDKNFEIDENNIVTWFKEIIPNQKVLIELEYSISTSKEMYIANLNY